MAHDISYNMLALHPFFELPAHDKIIVCSRLKLLSFRKKFNDIDSFLMYYYIYIYIRSKRIKLLGIENELNLPNIIKEAREFNSECTILIEGMWPHTREQYLGEQKELDDIFITNTIGSIQQFGDKTYKPGVYTNDFIEYNKMCQNMNLLNLGGGRSEMGEGFNIFTMEKRRGEESKFLELWNEMTSYEQTMHARVFYEKQMKLVTAQQKYTEKRMGRKITPKIKI